MNKYEVTFSLGSRGPSGRGAFIGDSRMQYQKMVVQASSSTQAQRIVEGMYGGIEKCIASPGVPIR